MKSRLPLVLTLLTALPLSLAVACGGEGDDDGSGGSGGTGGSDGGTGGESTDGGSGGTETGGTSSGGTSSGGTSSGGTGTGGMMGGAAGAETGGEGGMGGLGGLGGESGLPTIAESCTEICDTISGIDCSFHEPSTCQEDCEEDMGYAYYQYGNCDAEYQAYVDCLSDLSGSDWLCADNYFWLKVQDGSDTCDALETVYKDCDNDYYCQTAPPNTPYCD